MTLRNTIACLALALSFALLLPPRSSFAAEEAGTLPFLKMGSTYRIKFAGSTPFTVKILEPAGGHWFRVEYSSSSPDADERRAHQTWINFATVATVSESKESDKKEPEKKESEKK
jgi:hypothetical protein